MTGTELFSETESIRTLWGREEIVFASAAAALAAGVFVPLPDLLLDILLGFVVSLTIAVGAVFPAASSTADLRGFSAMLSVPALLRIGLVGALCVRLFGAESSGLLIPATGKVLTGAWPLAAALVCLVAAVILAMALFGACERIAGAAARYSERIFPLKCVGIETDVKMGVISTQQARSLARKVQAESRLFSNLTGTSLLMRVEGAIEIAAMLGCLVWPFVGAARLFESGSEQIAQAAAAAAGLTAFSLVPAVVSALAGAYLAGKDSLTLRAAPTEPTSSGRTFTLMDQETGQCEEVELLNPDFVARAEPNDRSADEERFAEFEPPRSPLIETLNISAGSVQAYYQTLARCAANASAEHRILVFAARQIRDLPVTVFVNTAIQLAQDGRKILLVDGDLRRNALAAVFEADARELGEAIRSTGFEGLDMYGLSGDPGRAKATLSEAERAYSCVLIYAPDTLVQPDLETILGAMKASAFVFGVEETSQAGQTVGAMGYCERIYITPNAPMQTESDEG